MAFSRQIANAQRDLKRYRKRDGVDPALRPLPQYKSEEWYEWARQVGPGIPKHIRAYPTLLTASIQANKAPHMRVYLLLQAYDKNGSGCLNLNDVRLLLTGKMSKWRIVGKRRLRSILNEGEGLFWDRYTADHIWLKSPAKIAEELGCGRLRGLPVELPARELLKGIGRTRAHFYASYESGRRQDAPISRIALEQLTGIPVSTQRHYDKQLNRKKRTNFVVTDLFWMPENVQKVAGAYRQMFLYVDWTGKYGKKRNRYVAYRIADSRNRIHQTASPARLRKINKRIPNVGNTTGRRKSGLSDIAYHPDAAKAGIAFNRDTAREHRYQRGEAAKPNAARKTKLESVGVYGVACDF